jgi:two-component system, OmpR family, sensor histidine kinase BaeS
MEPPGLGCIEADGRYGVAGGMVRVPRLLGPLGWRLFVAFVLSTVGVVAVVALLAVLSVSHQTDTAVQSQQAQQRAAIVDALITAYRKAGNTWKGADLTGIQALAVANGARVYVQDNAGGTVADYTPPPSSPRVEDSPEDNPDRGGNPENSRSSSGTPETGESSDDSGGGRGRGGGSGNGGGEDHFAPVPTAPTTAPPTTARTPQPTATSTPAGLAVPIMVNNTRIGTLTFDPAPAAGTAAWQARTAILRTVGTAAGLAVLLAAGAALLLSRTISRPLVGLAAAARAVEQGVPDATKLLRPGPGELGQVSRAFHQMANTLRREEELRRTLVADVAHELRTPVTILRGQTEQLLDGLAEPDTDRLASLHEEVLRLDRLVEDLATLSAAEAAGLRMERQPVALDEVLTSAVNAMRPQYANAEIELTLKAEPVGGYGDPQRLTQVFSNLLGNAAKFTPAGGSVRVELHRIGHQAVITVADTGPGIPAADRPHVFDRFWRGQSAGRRSGTGIGLAVVAELVTAHAGTVSVGSGPDGGALFIVRLPVA